MNNKDLENLVEAIYPYFLKKLKEDGYFKNMLKMKNATVTSAISSNIDKEVEVKFPYDTTSFKVLNKTGVNLKKNDLVCLMYWVDLKNTVAMFKK